MTFLLYITRLAQDGANIIIAAKTDVAHSTLEGTIYSVAKEVEALGMILSTYFSIVN